MGPALLAAIAQAALPIVQYVIGLPEAQRQAAIDALNAAAKSSNAAVAAFVTGSASDLADMQAKLAAVLAHPDLPPALVPLVTAVHEQVAERVSAPLPSGSSER